MASLGREERTALSLRVTECGVLSKGGRTESFRVR